MNKKISKLSTGKKGIKFKENDILFGKLRPYLKNYLLADFSGIAIGDFWVLRPLESPDFLFYLIQSQKFTYISNISSGSKMPRSDWKLVSGFHFDIPKINEQISIGKVLKLLDKLISLQQRKLKQLQLIRKGLLQQILKKNSNWKLTKLKSILKIRNEQIYPNINYPLMSFVQKKGVIPKNERYNRKFLVKGVKKYKVTKLGDFIYSSNNLDTGSIGVNKTRNAVISPVYSIFSSKSYRESQFVGLLSEDKYFIYKMLRYRQGVVYGQWKIPEKDFLNLEIKIPDQKTQENIINLFYKVDKIIDKEENLTTELSKLKKFLLQNMFM